MVRRAPCLPCLLNGCPSRRALPTLPADLCSQSRAPQPSSQAYDEIIAILKSLKKIKGTKISVKASLWGEAYAANCDKDTFVGTIDRWHDKDKKDLMVMWEGYSRCQKAPLDKLKEDEHGDTLDLRLLPGEDAEMSGASSR